jgi:GGDEF domain-containing protein
MLFLFVIGSPEMSAPHDSSLTPDTVSLSRETMIDTTPMVQFLPVFLMYVGWSTLAWLNQVTGSLIIAPVAAKILLLGICATNILFYLVARNNALHRPPTDTITLTQCVVGIAWLTLFTFMSSGSGELAIGIYASIILFAMLRVRHAVLNQIIIFALSSYSIISLAKMLTTEPLSVAPTSLLRLLIFAGLMLCLSAASQHIYSRHRSLEKKLLQLQAKYQHEHAGTGINSVNRRYILDLLAREKGRTDRSNVPFCLCVFKVDLGTPTSIGMDEDTGSQIFKSVEVVIRAELRDMDSLNAAGFHNCFGAYSDREFIAVLPQTNMSGARHSAERILASVSAQTVTDETPIDLCAGIAEYRRGEPISALLARAEEALANAQTSDADRIYAGESPHERHGTHHADIVRLETRRK